MALDSAAKRCVFLGREGVLIRGARQGATEYCLPVSASGADRRSGRIMAFVIIPCKAGEVAAAFTNAKRKGVFSRRAKLFRNRPNMVPPASHEFVGIVAVYAGTTQAVRYPVGVPER
jgi:hypothetical protein